MTTMPRGFDPLDLDSLPHLPGSAAVNRPPRAAADALLLADVLDGRALGWDRPAPVPVQRRRVIDLTAYVLAAMVALGAVVGIGQAPAAQAATRVTASTTATMGPGLNLHAAAGHTISPTLHAGWWIIGGRSLVCISYNRAAPDGSVAALSTPLPATSREADARLKTAANLTSGTDATSGAVLWFTAAHILVDDPRAKTPDAARLRKDLPAYERQVTPAVRARVKALLAASAVHDVTAVVALNGAVPGQVGTATVTATGSNGRPAAGRKVTWTITGGTAATSGKVTDAAGKATLTFRATGLGQSVTAVVTSPSSRTVWANRPSAGRQVVIGGGFIDTTKASAVAELCPVAAEHRTTCPCQHTGDREITVRWEAADLTGWYRGTVTVDGVEAAHADLAAGESGEATIHVQPGQDVEVRYSIYGTAARTGSPLVGDTLDEWTQR